MVSLFAMLTLLSFCTCETTDYNDLKIVKICVDEYCFPKVVWAYWESDIPEDVEEMMNVTKDTLALAGLVYCFLTERNISLFLNTSSFPMNFSKLWLQGKSDFIRVSLLEKYGGIWIDCSTYVNSQSEMEWFVSEAVKSRCQLVTFAVFPHHSYVGLINFFGSPENSDFFKRFKLEMDHALSIGVSEYIRRIKAELKLNPYKDLRDRAHTYLYIDSAFLKTVLSTPDIEHSLLYLPYLHSPNQLDWECDSNAECFRYRLLHDEATRNMPFIKVHKGERNGKRYFFKEGKLLNNVPYSEVKKRKKKDL